MTQATFKRVTDFDEDLPEILGWVSGKIDYHEVLPFRRCVQVYYTSALTQQEQDDITADAAARFILVEFSA